MSITTTAKIEAHLAELDPAVIEFSKTNEMFRDASDFTPEALRELANSIIENGLAQPILVRPTINGVKGKYILVAGERRLRAWKLANIPSGIPSYIRELSDEQALELQIIENLQREDLNPIKEARAFSALIKDRKMDTGDIAIRIGKSIDYVQERLRLAVLIPEAQKMIVDGYLPLKAGLKLARIPDAKQQKDCLEHCTTLNSFRKFDLNGSQVASNELPFKKTEKIIFKGMDEMQRWMDQHLFTDLERADFDKEDPKLNPAMGACSACRNRTKNTQGLFDDIIVDDKCLVPACYRIKQINTYKQLRDDLKKKYPKAKIIFKRRDNSIDGRGVFDKAGLGEVIGAGSGEIISDKKGQAMAKPTIAILIGISHFNDTDNDKKGWVYWQPTQKKKQMLGSSKSPELTETAKKQLSPEQQAAAERKVQDERRQKATLEEVMVDLALDQVIKSQTEEKVLEVELEALMEDCDWDFLHAVPRIFQRLGLNWTNGNKEISHKGFDTIGARVERDSDDDDIDVIKSLAKATIQQKRVVLMMGRLLSYYYLAGRVEKLFNVPTESARKQKASGKAGEIFKKWKADRDAREAADKLKKQIGAKMEPAAAGKKKGGKK